MKRLFSIFFILTCIQQINAQAPANDLACDAIAIAVDGSINNFDNTNATIEVGEAAIAPPVTGFNVTDGWGESTLNFTTWYTFVAPTNGNITINCTDVPFDGQIAVYEVTDCADFGTYTFIAGNDNAIDSSSTSPLFTVCGLTSGATYYLMYDSESLTNTGAFSIQLSTLTVTSGTITDTLDICTGDTANLFLGISGYDLGGTWSQIIPTLGLTDSLFNSAGLAYQVFDFKYITIDGCLSDTTHAYVHVFGPSSAGNDGTLVVCTNETVNLLGGLSGFVDLNGTWYNPLNQPLPGFTTTASSLPGQFNYDYIAGNDVCPDDTSNILLTVTVCTADLEENVFNNLLIYPNPTNGILTVSNINPEANLSFEVTDLNGRKVTDETIPYSASKLNIDLTGKKPGIYFLKLKSDNSEKTVRIILE